MLYRYLKIGTLGLLECVCIAYPIFLFTVYHFGCLDVLVQNAFHQNSFSIFDVRGEEKPEVASEELFDFSFHLPILINIKDTECILTISLKHYSCRKMHSAYITQTVYRSIIYSGHNPNFQRAKNAKREMQKVEK